MNSAQIQSLARWLANSISGGVIAYTAAKSPAVQGVGAYVSQLITGPDTIAAFVLAISWLWGHFTHSTPAQSTTVPIKVATKPPGTVLLLFFCLALAVMVGCAESPQRVAYQVVGTTQVSVETALQLYNQLAKAGKTTPAQNAAVKAAYLKYQACFALACDAGAAYSAAGSNTNSPALALMLSEATVNLNDTISDFDALVQSFGVKL